MSKQAEDYHLLNNANRSSHSLENEDDEMDTIYRIRKTPPTFTFSRKGVYLFVITILIPTTLLNLILSLAWYKSIGFNDPKKNRTPYADLPITSGTWVAHNEFTDHNITAVDEAWLAVDIDYGVIALSKEESEEMDLPASVAFPWDPENYSQYMVTSVHSIHCLKVLHRSNLEYRLSRPQTYHVEHIFHCLDNIRNDIECAADDTPRYIPVDTSADKPPPMIGLGQQRHCRDWAKLERWARQHTACFGYNEELTHELAHDGKAYPAAQQFCPEGSKFLPKVREYFGKGEDWMPVKPEYPDVANFHDA